jgi:hypothetical protein
MTKTNSAVTAEAVEVKAKIAKCWVQLENPHQAIEMVRLCALIVAPTSTLYL